MKIIDFVAGYTIKDAINKAIKTAKDVNQPVLADINNVVLIINKDTNIDKAIEEYRKKLDFKYEIEKLKREIDKEKQR